MAATRHHAAAWARAAVVSLLMGVCDAALKDIDRKVSGGADTFKFGETVKLECVDWESGAWGKGPICKETGEEFAITFGYNNFVYCGHGRGPYILLYFRLNFSSTSAYLRYSLGCLEWFNGHTTQQLA